MPSENLHISDQELLRAVDGELSRPRSDQVRAHLAACWHCRARMADIEGSIADFMRCHRQALDSQLPSADGPRALLRAQINELALQSRVSSWRWFFRFNPATRSAIISAGILAAVLLGGIALKYSILRGPNTSAAQFELGALPEHELTPGATRSVAISDVCSMPHEEVVREVSPSIREEVFKKYKIMNAKTGEYEIDFLIAPGLGGTEDIHNLWPQPYKLQTWNASVKDDLEERLHQLVCSGDLDLSTAQHDIATDWIAAYKKYFHTETPLADHSRIDTAELPRI